MGFEASDELVVRRVISRSGKNRVLINGQMATLLNLSGISESLVNICSQHEHQTILNAENHIDILDEFGGCRPLRADYEKVYLRYQQIKAQILKLENLRRSREEKTELIKFQLNEIENVSPTEDEDNSLAEEKKILVNIQKLIDEAHRAYDLLYGEGGSIIEKLKDVQDRIKEIKKIDTKLKLSESDIENVFYDLQEAALLVRDYSKSLFFDPQRMDAVHERLEMLNRLKRKYGGSLPSVLAKKREMENELFFVSNVEEELSKLSQEEITTRLRMYKLAKKLSQLRFQATDSLKSAVDKEIHALNMPHASFKVKFKKSVPAEAEPDSYGLRGVDDLEFYLTANVGEELKALNKVASGGELSRIVLALKKVLSNSGSVATIVFDEVDSGIGGATAEIVGRKLKDISINHQVICITHLPQIACYGDTHLRVAKNNTGGRITTTIERLEEEEQKIEEISRMLGGVDLTAMTREHAREMLKNANVICSERKGW
jgi:DNA repair protein RecN (Recombination protein N)